MIIIGTLKKTIYNVKYNGGGDGITEKNEIKHKEKNTREERMLESVRDVEGMGMILNNEGDNLLHWIKFYHQQSRRIFLQS